MRWDKSKRHFGVTRIVRVILFLQPWWIAGNCVNCSLNLTPSQVLLFGLKTLCSSCEFSTFIPHCFLSFLFFSVWHRGSSAKWWTPRHRSRGVRMEDHHIDMSKMTEMISTAISKHFQDLKKTLPLSQFNQYRVNKPGKAYQIHKTRAYRHVSAGF